MVKAQKSESNPYGLSPCEQKVLELWTSGMTEQQIAAALFNSTETIKTHRRKLRLKMGDAYPFHRRKKRI